MSRLVLFDIDETMINSSGAGRRALEKALFEEFGRPISFDTIPLSGKTDPQIISEVLHAHDLGDQHSNEMTQKILDRYLPYLEQEVESGTGAYKLHAGVVELLDVLKDKEHTFIGLLTGNVERGARIKLRRFDLNRYFDFGAFGCDSANRMELPAVAHERAKKKFGAPIEKHEIVIIGDAQNDVLCAKGYGAKALAVCTGRTTRDTLSALEPHFLFDTLADTPQIVDAIYAD